MLRFLKITFALLTLSACSATVVGTGEPTPTETEPTEPGPSSNVDDTAPAKKAPASKPPPSLPEEEPASVTGQWRGTIIGANEGIYLDISQTNISVSGVQCEGPNKDCYVLMGGRFENNRLTGSISWTQYGKTDSASLKLDLSTDGKTLAGTIDASKCSCAMGVSLLKQ